MLSRKIPNGIHGIEERLHILFETLVNTGRMTPSDVVRLFSTEAAKAGQPYSCNTTELLRNTHNSQHSLSAVSPVE